MAKPKSALSPSSLALLKKRAAAKMTQQPAPRPESRRDRHLRERELRGLMGEETLADEMEEVGEYLQRGETPPQVRRLEQEAEDAIGYRDVSPGQLVDLGVNSVAGGPTALERGRSAAHQRVARSAQSAAVQGAAAAAKARPKGR